MDADRPRTLDWPRNPRQPGVGITWQTVMVCTKERQCFYMVLIDGGAIRARQYD